MMGVFSCCRAAAYFLKYFGKDIDKRNSITDAYSYKYEFQLYIPQIIANGHSEYRNKSCYVFIPKVGN